MRCASTTPGARCSSAPTAPTPAPTARPTCASSAASRRATTRRRRSCSPAAAMRCGARPTPTARASSSTSRPASPRAAWPARCACTSSPTRRPSPACAATCASPACPRCCPRGATASGSRATSTRTRTTPRRTSTAVAGTASRSTRSCSTPRGRRNTTRGSPTRTSSRTSPGMVARWRAIGVRTVVWVTPWVNLESLDGQIPPDPGSRRLHREPAPNYEPQRFVRGADGEPYVARWWMGTGSMVDFTDPESEAWWRAQAVRALRLGVEGIKADDGEGYYVGEDLRFADGTTGAQTAWRYGGLYRRSMQRALDEAHGPGRGVLFGRSGWSGQQATGVLWAGDQASDFWSLRTLVASSIAAAGSGFSNWSHDVGGYLGYRLVERCPKELLLRWVQLGAFTPLMQAHGRLEQEPWTYDRETLELYRGYVLLHEMLNPYLRAAAASAARGGPPILRPASLLDPGGWEVADAFGVGPALWVAPVVEERRARARRVAAAGRVDRGVVGRARARRARGAGARAAARDPRVGPRRRDRRHAPRRVRPLRPRRGRRAVARHAVGRAALRARPRPAGRRDGRALGARALVGDRPGRCDLRASAEAFRQRWRTPGGPGFAPWTYRTPRKCRVIPGSASPHRHHHLRAAPRHAGHAGPRRSAAAPRAHARHHLPEGDRRGRGHPRRPRAGRARGRPGARRAPRRDLPGGRPRPRPDRLRRDRAPPPSSAPPTPPTTPSSSPSPAPPTPRACRCSASAAAPSR